ncbi:MAG: helix-turn-helix domain-containing protein [Candidatus Dormibacteraceae bacterium]
MPAPADDVTADRRRDPERIVRELGFLQRLARAAASTRQPDELVGLIIRETTSAMATDVCSLYLLQPGGRLLLSATNGLDENMVGIATLEVGEGVTGWVARTNQPLVVPDVSLDPHWKWVPHVDQRRFHSMLSVPIESGSRLVGVLNVQAESRRTFSGEDIEFLTSIAGQVAGILERSELQRRLEAQLAEISLSHDIHERFTRLSLEGAGIPAILEAVGGLAGGDAALYSGAGFRIRGLGPAAERLPARVPAPPALLRGDSREVRLEAGRPPRALDLVAVRGGGEMLGLLAVGVPQAHRDEEGRRRALEHGSTVLALELSKERAGAEVERRLRGDLVDELLGGGLDEPEAERLAGQAERLGHRIPARAWVLVLEPDDAALEPAPVAATRQDRLDAVLTDLGHRRLPGSLVVTRPSSAVLLVPEEVAPDLVAMERLAAEVLSSSAPAMRPGTASAGIGNLARAVTELPRSHQEARQALRLARRTGSRGRVTSYRSLGAFRLLLEVQNPEALERFVEEVLGNLVRYAESRETPLLETLEAMAEARWVRRRAARALGVHVNSLAYRLERIEALTETRLDDAETRVAVAIALRARTMLSRR